MARDISNETPIASVDDLVIRIASGEKPKEAFRIGTEHEKFPFYCDTLAPVPYEGERGIGRLLAQVGEASGWQAITDGPALIGLHDPHGGGAISLEPGGQFELSGAPLATVHETAAEAQAHMAMMARLGDRLGIGFLGLGASPTWTLAETPRMPKSRYDIMTAYMPKVGTRGLDMMYRTSTIQVNLDYADEADMVKKMRVGLSLQPIATALFSASPLLGGRQTGRLSERSAIWLDTDGARTGMLPFVFHDDFSILSYIDWALDVPMYFIKREESYIDCTNVTFRQFLAGAMPGITPNIGDFDNHLGTLFPEVRLKRYIEMRGADMGPLAHIPALSAFWVGLLYDERSLGDAWSLVEGWSEAERQELRRAVPVSGLRTRWAGGRLSELAGEVLKISRAGLERRDRRDAAGRSEACYLDVLDAIVSTGRSLAETIAERTASGNHADFSAIFRDFSL